jgi:hypothetical protein
MQHGPRKNDKNARRGCSARRLPSSETHARHDGNGSSGGGRWKQAEEDLLKHAGSDRSAACRSNEEQHPVILLKISFNICRDPFAEAFIHELRGRIRQPGTGCFPCGAQE